MNITALRQAFRLAYALHPEPTRELALAIVLEAQEQTLPGLRATQRKRQGRTPSLAAPETRGRYHVMVPQEALLQVAVYAVSERVERGQEEGNPATILPVYAPTAEDWLVRYIKCLVWRTMIRWSWPVAVGLGCHLYTYTLDEIALVGSWQPNPRTTRELRDVITTRFRDLDPTRLLPTRCPTAEERDIVTTALEVFAPWSGAASHLALPPNMSILESLFSAPLDRSDPHEWRRIHVLINPASAGLAGLVDEFNASRPRQAARLASPPSKLRLPAFASVWPPHSPGLRPGSGPLAPLLPPQPLGTKRPPVPSRHRPGDSPALLRRFQPPPLQDAEVRALTHALVRNQARRQAFRAGRLVLYMDHDVGGELGPHTGWEGTFSVAATVSTVTIVGYDADGPLLLAVVPLWEIAADARDAAAPFVLPQTGAYTMECTVQPDHRTTHEEMSYRLHLRYEGLPPLARPLVTAAPAAESHEPPRHPAPVTLGERLGQWLSPVWRPLWAGEPVTAADIPVQEHVFPLDEGEIRVTCTWQPAHRQRPATLRLAWHTTVRRPGVLWARFVRPEATATLLSEMPLGQAVEGEEVWPASTLGFDPTGAPWALLLVLKEPTP
jgi:hypothetical protein